MKREKLERLRVLLTVELKVMSNREDRSGYSNLHECLTMVVDELTVMNINEEKERMWAEDEMMRQRNIQPPRKKR